MYKVDNYIISARRLLSIDLNNVRDVVISGYFLLLGGLRRYQLAPCVNQTV